MMLDVTTISSGRPPGNGCDWATSGAAASVRMAAARTRVAADVIEESKFHSRLLPMAWGGEASAGQN